MNIERKLRGALELRKPLLESPDTDAYRVFNGAADGIDGLVIERFGPVLVVQLLEGRLKSDENESREICGAAMQALGASAVYRKIFVRERGGSRVEAMHRDATPWIGRAAEAEVVVKENGIRFLVRPYDGFSVGLFLDQRDNRRRIRELSGGMRVLNLFSYACGFSVAAGVGGAASTVSVDVSKRHLEWGKQNFALNGIDVQAEQGVSRAPGRRIVGIPEQAAKPVRPQFVHTFICSDAFDYFDRAARQRRTFDVVVLDPPSFARSGKSGRVFSIKKDLLPLVGGAMKLLVDGGQLFLSTNFRAIPLKAMEQVVREAAAGRKAEIVSRPALPMDFRGDPDYAKSILVRMGG